MIQQTPENKEQLGNHFADILENFATGTTVSIHWDIPKLPTQASGIYASAIINEDDLSQLNKLESHGLIQIDQATNDEYVKDQPINEDELNALAEAEKKLLALKALYQAGLIAPEIYSYKSRQFAKNIWPSS